MLLEKLDKKRKDKNTQWNILVAWFVIVSNTLKVILNKFSSNFSHVKLWLLNDPKLSENRFHIGDFEVHVLKINLKTKFLYIYIYINDILAIANVSYN